MKAMILTASLGGGHNAVARALAVQLEKMGVTAKVVDVHGNKHPMYKKLVFRSYVTSMNLFSLTPDCVHGIYNSVQQSRVKAKPFRPAEQQPDDGQSAEKDHHRL